MKKRYLFLPTLLIITILSFSTKTVYAKTSYFLIDYNNPEYKINSVKLSAKELYNTSKEVELYNLKYKDRLILFSILPNATMWKEISQDELKSKQIDFKTLAKTFENGFDSYLKLDWDNSSTIKRDDIIIVIHKNNKYMAANFCLSEYFALTKDPLLFPNQMGEGFINVNSPMLSAKDFEALFFQKYKTKSPNVWLDVSDNLSKYYFFRRPLNFLSGVEEVAGKKAYRFWHYSDWRVYDGYNTLRGVDRFLFIPEIGIVAGSYDFWFGKNISNSKLEANYLAEKLMYPIEINGEPIK